MSKVRLFNIKLHIHLDDWTMSNSQLHQTEGDPVNLYINSFIVKNYYIQKLYNTDRI